MDAVRIMGLYTWPSLGPALYLIISVQISLSSGSWHLHLSARNEEEQASANKPWELVHKYSNFFTHSVSGRITLRFMFDTVCQSFFVD